MLDEAYFSHGTSLVLSKDGKVFGTTVFAYKYDFEEQEITLHWDTALAKRNPSSFVINGKSFDQWEWNSGYAEKKLFALVKGKMPLTKTSMDKGMQLAAQKHLLYLKSNKSIGCEESSKNSNYYEATTKKRYLKATKYKSSFFTLFNTIGEKSFVYDCTLEELKNKSIFVKIEKELQTEFSQRNQIKNWGAAVILIEKENQYQVIIDVVWVEKLK